MRKSYEARREYIIGVHTMNWGVGEPFAKPCLISAFVNTISVSFTVRSSSFEAPSCATEGRIHTGGTDMYCQMNSSGRPHLGFRPSNSQSYIDRDVFKSYGDVIHTNSAHLV